MAAIYICCGGSSIDRGNIILTGFSNLEKPLVQLPFVLDAAASFGAACDKDEAHAESPNKTSHAEQTGWLKKQSTCTMYKHCTSVSILVG